MDNPDDARSKIDIYKKRIMLVCPSMRTILDTEEEFWRENIKYIAMTLGSSSYAIDLIKHEKAKREYLRNSVEQNPEKRDD